MSNASRGTNYIVYYTQSREIELTTQDSALIQYIDFKIN